jgi:hypothetical protein
MQRQLRDSRPKLKLVAVAVAAMATGSADYHNRRRAATTAPRPLLVRRTTSVPLHLPPLRRPEPKQAQNMVHRDLSAKPVEIDAWHGTAVPWHGTAVTTLAAPSARRSFDRSVPFLSMGNGNDPLDRSALHAANDCARSNTSVRADEEEPAARAPVWAESGCF